MHSQVWQLPVYRVFRQTEFANGPDEKLEGSAGFCCEQRLHSGTRKLSTNKKASFRVGVLGQPGK
jgi:hypothetical protein